MRRCPEALIVHKKLASEAASEDSSDTSNALIVTDLENALFSRADEHNVLLYIKSAAAHTRDRKRKTIFKGRAVHLYAVIFLEQLRNRQSTACEKHSLSLEAFLLTAILQTKTFLLPVKKMYSNRMGLFFCDQEEKKEF